MLLLVGGCRQRIVFHMLRYGPTEYAFLFFSSKLGLFRSIPFCSVLCASIYYHDPLTSTYHYSPFRIPHLYDLDALNRLDWRYSLLGKVPTSDFRTCHYCHCLDINPSGITGQKNGEIIHEISEFGIVDIFRQQKEKKKKGRAKMDGINGIYNSCWWLSMNDGPRSKLTRMFASRVKCDVSTVAC